MPRTRPPYPPEFRAEAVELIRSGTKSFRELSRDLGISDQTLRNWVRQADLDAGRRTTGLRLVSAKNCVACARKTARCAWSETC